MFFSSSDLWSCDAILFWLTIKTLWRASVRDRMNLDSPENSTLFHWTSWSAGGVWPWQDGHHGDVGEEQSQQRGVLRTATLHAKSYGRCQNWSFPVPGWCRQWLLRAEICFAGVSVCCDDPAAWSSSEGTQSGGRAETDGWDVAQLVEHRTVTPLTQVRFPGAARDFLQGVNFQCRHSFGVRTPQCAIACINICAHVKDPVVHVRVRWIMATQAHPARTIVIKWSA